MAVLLHLSDIHFRRYSGSPFDIDTDLRNELVLDAKSVHDDVGPPNAILVGGDIAHSGQRSEYEAAKKWLDELASTVGVTFANVWCVPGNHDVDQNVIRNSPILMELQNAIRGSSPNGIDQKLLSYLGDPVGKIQLYNSIAEFNAFGEPYGFNYSADKPINESDIALNDRSVLRIHGLNSTFVSNHLDNQVKTVVLGRFQLPKRVSGVINVVLCHHPPDWWSDDDSVKDDIGERAHIQLYGHKHRQTMHRINNSVRLVAGAVHPDREESAWRPRYNWLVVDVITAGTSRSLRVKVFPRVWSENGPHFVPDANSCDGQPFKIHMLDLDPWIPPSIPNASAEIEDSESPIVEDIELTNPMTNPLRVLTFRLFELPYLTRISIAQDLGLMRNEDAGLRDYDVFHRVLARAQSEDKLADLWDKVQSAHQDHQFTDNPFRSSKGGKK